MSSNLHVVDSHENISSLLSTNSSLTTESAMKRLHEALQEIVDKEEKKNSIFEFYRIPISTTALVVLFCLSCIGFVFYDIVTGKDSIFVSWVPVLLEVVLFIGTIWLYIFIRYRDQRNQIVDQRDRIQSVLDMIKTNTKLDYQEIRIPFGTRSVDCIRVIRDNQVYVIPSVLGVAGDTIEMAYGEIACCKMRLMTDTKDSVFNSREFILEKGEYLKPDSLCSFYGSRDKMSQLSGRYKFVLMETPFVSVLSETLKCKRPEPLLEYQRTIVQRRLSDFLLPIMFIISLIICVSVFLVFKQIDVVWVLYYPWLVCFPLFPFSFLITFYVFKAYGNARISILFEVLKKEKTPYELYDLGEDEFDIEAGPPTKDVVLPFNQVLKKVLKLTFFKDKQSLTNSTHLLESLASVSVMCFVDKIGVLTHPYPSAKSLMFINNTSSTESIDVHLDSQSGYIFQENLWKERLTIRKDLHRKLSALTNYGSCPTSRQSCLCSLSRAIGFNNDSITKYKDTMEIFAFSPFSSSLKNSFHSYKDFEIPSMSCLAIVDSSK
ncbi:hypothetical protein ROZALSC1DRAFT_20231, partial [Rozella allomycis CSF55]